MKRPFSCKFLDLGMTSAIFDFLCSSITAKSDVLLLYSVPLKRRALFLSM